MSFLNHGIVKDYITFFKECVFVLALVILFAARLASAFESTVISLRVQVKCV